MSPPGRPKGEHRRAQPAGAPVTPPGRPKGEHRSAKRRPVDGVLLVVTTVGNVEQARTLARAMVEQRLAACAQIEAIESFYRWHGAVEHDAEPAIESFYRWHGAVEHDAEQRVLFKTRPDGYAALEAAIRAQHPYELPAIHAIAAAHAFAPYAAWVAACTTPAAQ